MRKILVMILALSTLAGCGFPKEEMTENFPKETLTDTEIDEAVKRDEISDEVFVNVENKSFGWGIKKNKGSEPDVPDNLKELLRNYNSFYMDERREKVLYLTFDEGYENGYTQKILDTLKECGVPAAFFVTGPYLKTQPDLVRRMIEEGHIVGNHTVNHPNLPKLVSAEKMASEIGELNEMFLSEYGIGMKYMRPPEGECSERLLKVADRLGYKTIFWSFAYKDWDPKQQKGAEYALNEVTSYIHDGAILLLHAVSKDNADALSDIINYAKNQGYEFKSLDHLSHNT